MKPVNLAIIGTGVAARKLHWPPLSQLKNQFRLVQVCNHTVAKAREFSELVGGVPYTTDYNEVLTNPAVEAVDIILPIELNYSVTEAALQAGKHVLVEKPLAANLDDARQMLAFPEKYPGLAMMVAENFRYADRFRKCAEIIASCKIGKPYAVFWDVFFKVDDSNEYAKTQWRLNHQYPGGFITDGGVHNIAAIRDLFGNIENVRAVTASINPTIGEIDSLSFQFTTINRITGVLNIFLSSQGYSENKLKILGTEGSLVLVDKDLQMLDKTGQVVAEGSYPDMGYRGELEDFYGAIRKGRQPVSTFARAYEDLATILTALDGAIRVEVS